MTDMFPKYREGSDPSRTELLSAPSQASADCIDHEQENLVASAKEGAPPALLNWQNPIQIRRKESYKSDWKDVRLVCFDAGVAVVKESGNYYALNQERYEVRNTPPAPRECEAWVNVYEDKDLGLLFGAGTFISEDSARTAARAVEHGSQRKYIKSMKVSFTEDV